MSNSCSNFVPVGIEFFFSGRREGESFKEEFIDEHEERLIMEQEIL